MLTALCLFVILCSGSALVSAFTERRFERTLPLTVFSLILLMYVFGLFDALRCGAICVTALALLCWIAALARLVGTRGFSAFARRFFTPAFCIYAGLFILACVGNLSRKVSAWDDLAHWADVVKQMCAIQKFGANAEAVLFFPDYPPAMSLLQYYVQMLARFLGSTDFSEWLLFLAYAAALYAPFLPFLDKLRYRRWFTNLCVFAAIFLLPAALLRSQFRMLQIDAFLGVVAGCGLASAALLDRDDAPDMALCVLYAFVLTLSKSVGLFFAVVLAAALLMGALCKGRGAPARGLRIKRLWPPCAAAIAIAVSRLTWQGYMAANHTVRTPSDPLDPGLIWRLLGGQGDGWRQEAWDAFWRELFAPVFPVGILEVFISFAAVLGILIAAAVLLYMLRRDAPGRRLLRVFLLGLAATALYAFGLCAAYQFGFSKGQALILTSFSRYMAVPLIMLMALLFCGGVYRMEEGRPRHRAVAALTILALLAAAPAQEAGSFLLGRNRAYSDGVRAPVDDCVAAVAPLIGEDARRIYFVSAGDDGSLYLMFRFQLRPHLLGGSWYEPLLDAEGWRARLVGEDFDYVLLHDVDEAFRAEYAALFTDAAGPEADCLYAVDPLTGQLRRVS